MVVTTPNVPTLDKCNQVAGKGELPHPWLVAYVSGLVVAVSGRLVACLVEGTWVHLMWSALEIELGPWLDQPMRTWRIQQALGNTCESLAGKGHHVGVRISTRALGRHAGARKGKGGFIFCGSTSTTSRRNLLTRMAASTQLHRP